MIPEVLIEQFIMRVCIRIFSVLLKSVRQMYISCAILPLLFLSILPVCLLQSHCPLPEYAYNQYSFHLPSEYYCPTSIILTIITFSTLCSSILFDFYTKTKGRGDIYDSMLPIFPTLDCSGIAYSQLSLRALLLTCLTIHHAELWEQCFGPVFTEDCWAKDDPRLYNRHFRRLTPTWERNVALRVNRLVAGLRSLCISRVSSTRARICKMFSSIAQKSQRHRQC